MAVSHSYLPEDVIIDILSSLPVKSLIRFKSVSKLFYSITTNPKFIATHLHRSTQNPSLLIYYTNGRPLERYGISLLQDGSTRPHDVNIASMIGSNSELDKRIRVVGSSGGLLCITFSSTFPNFVLLNPTTRQFRYIPQPEYPTTTEHICYWAFGYNSEINDYKLVIIWHMNSTYCYAEKDQHGGVFPASVFSRRTGSWKLLGDNVPFGHYHHHPESIKGKMYWLSKKPFYYYHADFILAFDMIAEVFRKIDLPVHDRRLLLCEICGFQNLLAVFIFPSQKNSDYKIDLWVMNENSKRGGGDLGSWIKLFTIKYSYLGIPVHPVSIWKGKVAFPTQRNPSDQYGFLLHDPTDSSFEAAKFIPVTGERSYFQFYNYVASLASVYEERELIKMGTHR